MRTRAFFFSFSFHRRRRRRQPLAPAIADPRSRLFLKPPPQIWAGRPFAVFGIRRVHRRDLGLSIVLSMLSKKMDPSTVSFPSCFLCVEDRFVFLFPALPLASFKFSSSIDLLLSDAMPRLLIPSCLCFFWSNCLFSPPLLLLLPFVFSPSFFLLPPTLFFSCLFLFLLTSLPIDPYRDIAASLLLFVSI